MLTLKKKQVYLEKYFGIIPIESQLVETDKLILKYIWNSRRPQITKLKQEQSRTYTPQFQNSLQSNNNQGSEVMA